MRHLYVLALAATLGLSTGISHAEIVQISLTGEITHLQASGSNSIYSGVELAYTNAMSGSAGNNSYAFVFTYDTSITPSTSAVSGGFGSATFTQGITLLSGHAGSFSDFSGFTPSIRVSRTITSFPFTRDNLFFELDDPTSSRFASINFDFGPTHLPTSRQGFTDPTVLPAATTIAGPISAIYASFETRSGQNFFNWQDNVGGGNSVNAIVATPVLAPEPATAGVLAVAASGLLLRRRRLAMK